MIVYTNLDEFMVKNILSSYNDDDSKKWRTN